MKRFVGGGNLDGESVARRWEGPADRGEFVGSLSGVGGFSFDGGSQNYRSLLTPLW
jgi:hypothetical protein